jgi:hypothetical protein
MAVASMLVAGQVRAAPADSTGTIRGDVLSNGRPVPYANVVLVGMRIGALADSLGRFVIERAPVGTHRISAAMIGYERREVSIPIVPGENPSLSIELIDRRAGVACHPCFWVNPFQGSRTPLVRDGLSFTGEDWTASARGHASVMSISSDPDPCRLRIDYSPLGRPIGRLVIAADDGRVVRTFGSSGHRGVHVTWDGVDAAGRRLPLGAYRAMAVTSRDTLALAFERVDRPPLR